MEIVYVTCSVVSCSVSAMYHRYCLPPPPQRGKKKKNNSKKIEKPKDL
jgi:hypothetical protein